MLISWRLWIFSIVKNVFPETICFSLKRILLRWCGVNSGTNVRVCSSASFFGCGELEIGDNTSIGHECLIINACSVVIGERLNEIYREVIYKIQQKK